MASPRPDDVGRGGHGVPVPGIRRRFEAGLRNPGTVFKPLVDERPLVDNADDAPVLIDPWIE